MKKPYHSQGLMSNYPCCLPFNSYDTTSENLVVNQLLILQFMFSFILSLVWLILYRYSKEKFCLGHFWRERLN